MPDQVYGPNRDPPHYEQTLFTTFPPFVREQPRQLEPLRLVPSAHVSKGDPHLAGAKETALQANPAIPGQKNRLGHRQQVGLLKRWEL